MHIGDIRVGCLSFTVPKTRADEIGNIYQVIDNGEASSCTALASNLSTLSVKLAINMTNPVNLNSSMTRWFMAKIFKETYREVMKKTSCGYSSIADCNSTSNNCPGGTTEPSYTDDFIEVTNESLFGGCH